jgi:hypothetical protein
MGQSTIRPPDPAIVGTTMRYMPIRSHEAVRRLVHLAFRDCHSSLDLTFAHGRFWTDPLPPGLSVTTNNLDPSSDADLHIDFQSTGLPDDAYDLVIYDPPHIADGGKASIMATRYGTVKGTSGLREMIQAGAREAWRVARVGVLVKVADHSHQGRHQRLSRWVEDALGAELYFDLHTYRSAHLRDGKHRGTRVPRSNGASYLVFRKSGPVHLDFDRLYDRQQALSGGEEAACCGSRATSWPRSRSSWPSSPPSSGRGPAPRRSWRPPS